MPGARAPHSALPPGQESGIGAKPLKPGPVSSYTLLPEQAGFARVLPTSGIDVAYSPVWQAGVEAILINIFT